MFLVYIIILFIILIAAFFLRGYHREYSKSLSVKEHPLKIIYGLCYFLIDVYGRIFRNLLKKEPFRNTKKKLLQINCEVPQPMHIFLAKPVSICISIVIIFMLIGIFINITNDSKTPIKTLERPTDGSEYTDYNLNAYINGETSEITVKVPQKTYEAKDILPLFEKYHDDLVKTVLAENSSPEHVTKALYFPSSIGDEGISLSFTPEDSTYIDSNGNLLYDNIPNDGVQTRIEITMKLYDFEASVSINVILYPDESDSSLILQKTINDYIKNNTDSKNDSVNLPDNIMGNEITYYSPSNNPDIVIFSIIIVSMAIILLAAKKEIDQKLKKRNIQMMQDYPHLVSKLLLLINAGLNIRNALNKIVMDYRDSPNFKKRYAYEELSVTLNSLNNGKSESRIYTDFGKRCGLMPYIKLGSLLEQNINKGSKELRYHLTNEVHTALANHKADTILRSKYAETKLLFPMALTLIVIMLMIMVPSFISI